MSIIEKLPELADAGLKNLHDNALRLEREGSAAQRRSAAELLPLIDGELAERKAAKLANRKKRTAKATSAVA